MPLTIFSEAFHVSKVHLNSLFREKGLPLHQIETIHITGSEVLDQLQIIYTCKPLGLDIVSPKVLKLVAQSIYKPLTELFKYITQKWSPF